MKAMWIAFAAMIVIAIGAKVILEQSGFSTADKGSGTAVRLD